MPLTQACSLREFSTTVLFYSNQIRPLLYKDFKIKQAYVPDFKKKTPNSWYRFDCKEEQKCGRPIQTSFTLALVGDDE